MVPIFMGPETVGWRCGHVEDGMVHLEPVGDLLEHEVVDCACMPRLEPVERGDGSIGWLVSHHSWDGREQRERRGVS